MADLTFNTGAEAVLDREMLLAFLNTGTSSTPVWSPLGKRVSDSSMELDWGVEVSRDILGNTYGDMLKPTITQTFDPWNITAGDPAAVKLWNLAVKDHDVANLSAQDVLIVHTYAGTANTAVFAERYPASAIAVTGLGGEGGGRISMPIEITYGGERQVGTASMANGVPTFTQAT